jgi:hypothetical protein
VMADLSMRPQAWGEIGHAVPRGALELTGHVSCSRFWFMATRSR